MNSNTNERRPPVEKGMTTPAWTVQSLVEEMAARGSDPAVLSLHAGRLTVSSFEEIATQAKRLAAGLVAMGHRQGEAVLLFGPNSVDWIVARLAIGACGGLCVALDDVASDEEVRALVALGRCRRAFCAAAQVTRLHGLVAGGDLEICLLDQDDPAVQSPSHWHRLLADQPTELARVSPSAPAMLLYTSGTTGLPKAFTLSSANIAANIQALTAERLIGGGDRLLLPLPLHHAYPQVVGLFTVFASGAAVILPESVAGPKILEALRAADATGIIGVPRLYGALASSLEAQIASRGRAGAALFRSALKGSILLRRRFDWNVGFRLFRSLRRRLAPNLRLLVSGGARLEAHVLWTLIGLGWELRSGYGLAETSSIFTGNLPGRERIGSEGKPFSGGRLRIADPDDGGGGEIQLSGPSLFSGYLDDPEATRAAFTDDRWFRTGDLGYLDEDGFLYVTGRSKELVVLGGGKKVAPEGLERVYGASPYIKEIAVLESDGALVGLIVPDLAAIRADGFTRVEDVLRVTLKETGSHLPSHQRLAGFAMTAEALPRTRLGKLRRFMLPELYEQAIAKLRPATPRALSDDDRALLQNPAGKAVWDLMAQRYPQERLFMDADLELDLGVDSLEWVALSLELKRLLSLEIDDADLAGLTTLRDLLRFAGAAEAKADASLPPPHSQPLALDGARWLAPTGPVTQVVTRLLYLLNCLLVRSVFRLRARGLENLPRQGPLIVVANHCSDLDPFIVAAALPWEIARRVHWGGDAGRLFRRFWLRPIIRAAHIFPVDGRLPAKSLALAREVLRNGGVLIWFPEEWRSPTGELQRFQPGIGWIVAESGVEVVPAYIEGAFEALPRHRRWPRLCPVGIRFGHPIGADDVPGAPEGVTDPKAIAESLHAAVAKLVSGGKSA